MAQDVSSQLSMLINTYLVPFGWKLIGALAVWVVGGWVVRLLRAAIDPLVPARGTDPRLRPGPDARVRHGDETPRTQAVLPTEALSPLFEAALEASFPASKRPQEGESVSGIIAGITPDVVLVSIGAKSEALMDLHELEGEKVGDRIDAVVIKAGPDIRLSRKLAVARRAKAELRAAWEAGIPVLGKVLSRNKGGFEVAIGGPGGPRAFCPVSQIDVGRHDEPGLMQFVGQSFDFRVIEYSDFLCPDCLFLHEQLLRLKAEFAGKINIAFQFFPLDHCNEVVMEKANLHAGACDLAYIAAHDPGKFLEIHNDIFSHYQEAKSPEWRIELAKRYGVEASLSDPNTKDLVHRIMNTGSEYEKTSAKFAHGIRSTPTIIVNNRMIIGTLPYGQMKAIFEALLEESGQAGDKRFLENWVPTKPARKKK